MFGNFGRRYAIETSTPDGRKRLVRKMTIIIMLALATQLIIVPLWAGHVVKTMPWQVFGVSAGMLVGAIIVLISVRKRTL
jgi:hypothetical protein